MNCKKCGKEISRDAAFCPSCGEKVGTVEETKPEESKVEESKA